MITPEMRESYKNFSPEQYQAFWAAGGVINGQEYPIASGWLHTHTDLGSPKDAILTVSDYLKIAEKMGARWVSITDHGTMFGVIPLYQACVTYNADHKGENKDIFPILGEEFYVCEDVEDQTKKTHTRLHLIAYATSDKGYHALCRLTTAANNRIIKAGKNNYPCISKKLLEEYIGPGSEGHGEVILTSACIGGVVAGVMYVSEAEKKNAADFEKKINEATTLKDSIIYNSQKVDELTQQKDALKLTAKQTYKKRLAPIQKALASYEDWTSVLANEPEKITPDMIDATIDHYPEVRDTLLQLRAVAEDMIKTREAAAEVKRLDNQLKSIKKVVTDCSTAIKTKIKAFYAKQDEIRVFGDDTLIAEIEEYISKLQVELKECQDNIISEEQAPVIFEKEMKYYQELAGEGNWYIEVQYHGIDAETKYMPVLVQLANKLNIPLVAANDAHMATREMAPARKIVNGLRFDQDGFRWQDPTPDEYELYLKSDAELYAALCRNISAQDALQAMLNREQIAQRCKVELEFGQHYPKFPLD